MTSVLSSRNIDALHARDIKSRAVLHEIMRPHLPHLNRKLKVYILEHALDTQANELRNLLAKCLQR